MRLLASIFLISFSAMLTAFAQEPPKIVDARPRGRVQSSPEVLQKRHVDAFQRHRYRVMVRASEVKALPDSFDCRAVGWTTSVTDQGNCGDCYGDSACRVFSAQRKKGGYADIFTFQYGLDWHHEFGGCNGGDEGEVIAFFKSTGWPNTTSYPYSYTASPSSKRALKGDVTKLDDWGYCTPAQTQGIASTTDVMTMMLAHGEISTAVNADGLWDSYNGGVMGFKSYSANSCNHAVSLVGWVKDATVKNGGYWIVRNNWGIVWGENGDAKIPFGSHALCTESIWLSVTPLAPPPPDPPNPPAPPQPVPPGPTPVPPTPVPPGSTTITLSGDMKAGAYEIHKAGTQEKIDALILGLQWFSNNQSRMLQLEKENQQLRKDQADMLKEFSRMQADMIPKK